VLSGSAEKIPFEDSSIDLIVSNLGVNNFDGPELVFKECNRVLKPGGSLALTSNLNRHWKEFYDAFEWTLRQGGHESIVKRLREHQEHRGTVATISDLFTANGFSAICQAEDSFSMNFLDGSAFLNHHFIKLGWLESWKNLLPPDELPSIFSALEYNLNELALRSHGLSLSVPMVFMEGQKV